MRFTRRKMDEVAKLIDNKIDEFKRDLMLSIKQLITTEIKSFIESKDNVVGEYADSINAIKEHVAKLQNNQMNLETRYSVLESKFLALDKKIEKLEQYTRRQNVRIFGVPVVQGETPEMVEETVLGIIGDCDICIKKSGLDRVHCTGKEVTREVMVRDEATGENKKTNITHQPIIVRFKSFRSRTKFYRNRKAVKDKLKYGIALDLTSDRYKLLQRAK